MVIFKEGGKVSYMIHTESGSIYEFEFKDKRFRRVKGKSAPTERTGSDGIWQSYVNIGRHLDGLLVTLMYDHTEDVGKIGRAILTSRVINWIPPDTTLQGL